MIISDLLLVAMRTGVPWNDETPEYSFEVTLTANCPYCDLRYKCLFDGNCCTGTAIIKITPIEVNIEIVDNNHSRVLQYIDVYDMIYEFLPPIYQRKCKTYCWYKQRI